MSKSEQRPSAWLGIWFCPRKTVQSIVETNPRSHFWLLSLFYGAPMVFHSIQRLSLGDILSSWGIIVTVALLSIFVGMLGIVVTSALIFWTGRWIGGEAPYLHIRGAVSWSNVPGCVSLFVWIVLFLQFGGDLFTHQFSQVTLQGGARALMLGAFLLQVILSVWSFVMLIKGVAQVQGFSAWKGVLNVLIPFFLVGVFMWAITWTVWVISGIIGI